MTETEVHSAFERLSQFQSIVITTHVNPDGDAIGSALGLAHYFRAKSWSCRVVVPNAIARYLTWLPGAEDILIAEDHWEQANQLILEADAICCVDFNALNRLGDLQKPVAASRAFKVLIDHHLAPESFCDVLFSTTEISSTSELIYRLIALAGDLDRIDLKIAECLYVGIITDTGSFSYSCNYEDTYFATAHLIRLGLDSAEIHHKVYDTFSEGRLRLLGYCLSERLKVMPDCGTAYMYLTKEDLIRFNYQTGDTEGVVNYALSLEGINLAALFTEKEGKIRISFRSKGNFSVNQFARSYFNGGGHKNAAGGDSYLGMETSLQLFEQYAAENTDAIRNS